MLRKFYLLSCRSEQLRLCSGYTLLIKCSSVYGQSIEMFWKIYPGNACDVSWCENLLKTSSHCSCKVFKVTRLGCSCLCTDPADVMFSALMIECSICFKNSDFEIGFTNVTLYFKALFHWQQTFFFNFSSTIDDVNGIIREIDWFTYLFVTFFNASMIEEVTVT